MRASPEALFACRLAMALGKSLGEIGAMSPGELAMWRAYEQIEPFGDVVRDWHQAWTPFVLAQVYAGKGHTPDFEEFFLAARQRGKARRLTPEQSAIELKAWAAAHNARIKKDGHDGL